MIIFLSLKCFSFFLSIELLIGYLKKIPIRNGKGDQIGYSTYAMGGVYDGKRVKFLSFECVCTN